MAHSLTQIIEYINSASFTFPAGDVNFTGTDVELKLKDKTGFSFPISCASSTGFSWDAALAEFASSVVRTVDKTPTNSIIGSKFNSDLNANWRKDGGSLTASLHGTPTVVGGEAVCTGNNGFYYSYTTGAVETHIFQYNPNYTSVPPANVNIITINNGVDSKDRAVVSFSPSGSIRLGLNNSVGGVVYSVGSPLASYPNPAGAKVEMRLVINSTAGTIKYYIGGALAGTLSPGPWTRSAAASRVYLGAFPLTYNRSEANYDDYIYFSGDNGLTSYTIPDRIYLENAVTCPESDYDKVGALQALTNFLATTVGNPNFTIQIGRSGDYLYWDGAAFSVADGSYTQSTDKATFLANIADLPINGEIYFQFKIHFGDSNTQDSVADFTTTATGQTYTPLVSSPLIVNNSGVQADGIYGVSAVVTPPTATAYFRFVFLKDGVPYWHNGSAWVVSADNTEANTIADLNTYAPDFDISDGPLMKIGAYPITTDGESTPALTSVTMNYDFEQDPTDPDKCVVYGVVTDVNGDPIEGATVECVPTEPFYYNELLVCALESVTTDSEGRWDMPVIENATYGGTYTFTTKYLTNGIIKKKTDKKVSVDNVTTAPLSGLI